MGYLNSNGGVCMDKPLFLVADDDQDVCELISLYLEKEGYETIFAYDGLAALDIIRKKQPNLVILDIMMPKKTGWEVCQEIRKESTIPIIMLTAKGFILYPSVLILLYRDKGCCVQVCMGAK
jgi:CheY-like chemotaxis protein